MALTAQEMEFIRTTAKLAVEEGFARYRRVAKQEADAAVKLHAAECPTQRQFLQDRNRIIGMIILASGTGGGLATGIGWIAKFWK